MKVFSLVVLLGICLMFFVTGVSSAEMCGCMGKMGGDMPMMGHGMMGDGVDMMPCGMMGKKTMHRMMADDQPMMKHLLALGLDDKQKEALREIKNREMKEVILKKADKQIAEVEIKELLAKDPVDMKAIEARLRQMEALKTDIHLSHLRAMENIKSILTPEQQKKLKGMSEMGPMMGCGMMGGMAMMHGHDSPPCGMMQDDGEDSCPPCEMKEGKQPPMEHRHHQ